MVKKVLISAGEASGDLHAANLVKKLIEIDSSVEVMAMGGDNLRDAGADVIIDCAELAVVGVVEVLINYRKIKRALDKLSEVVINQKPDLLILVDYQEFNMKLAQTAKKNGVKVLFYIGPQVWAWRPHRVHKMREKIDMMAVLFPFEVAFYENANVPVKFVGNPLVDEVKANTDKLSLINQYQLSPELKTVGLLPGSRKSEIKRILPIQLESARQLKQKHPQLQFVLAVASTLSKSEIEQQCQQYSELDIKFIRDLPYNVMSVCDAIITASGTATLETGLMEIPLAITYRISPLSYAILRRMMTIDKVGLVNIVAEKMIVKEFIQQDAVPEKIAGEISEILENDDYRENMINELKQVKQKLGIQGGSKIVAELAYQMLTNNEHVT
ncbi:lipid-A-disaccharide synthase [Aliikangiella coralliicola]|uniref:Lipid-A-disaccharide synthase n=1 Tax=Aliikangiella coralliicola TaxID=2592383 RepID=A0A545UAZ1_9GAMM|nr:lipid-A-disaccharide synthase [Aliikangiella coralliicola]TQV86631.1 lipid-A-disaccharide synthase [Aliikangiella coralliicola]